MTQYRAKRVNLSKINSAEEYRKAVTSAPFKYCHGIAELREYCGGHLHRCRNGGCYSGFNGDIVYVAEKC